MESKKSTILFLILLIAVLLSGCAGGEAPAPPPDPPPATLTPFQPAPTNEPDPLATDLAAWTGMQPSEQETGTFLSYTDKTLEMLEECGFGDAWVITQIDNVSNDAELWKDAFWLSGTARALDYVTLYCGELGTVTPMPPEFFNLNNRLFEAAAAYKQGVENCKRGVAKKNEALLVEGIMNFSQGRTYLSEIIHDIGTALDHFNARLSTGE